LADNPLRRLARLGRNSLTSRRSDIAEIGVRVPIGNCAFGLNSLS
jgi:hypothetical protein